jgi:DNA-3-methyladenine glycosylase
VPVALGGRLLEAEFFARPTLEVARDLLGKVLVRDVGDRRLTGRLVEVEAYCGPADLAAHSSRGRTPRTEVMFGPPGRAYVYLIYGMHHCLNFVTRPEGEPQAVLVRALEPGPGVERTSGPGLVCRALEIDRRLNGAPLEPPDLYVLDDGFRPGEVFTTPRIGVDYSGEWSALPWRFCLDSPHLSRPLRARRGAPRRDARGAPSHPGAG